MWKGLLKARARTIALHYTCPDGGAKFPNIFHLVGAGVGSYSSMNRRMLVASLSLASWLLLVGCATDDDDPFPVRSAAAAGSDAPVAGAATPPPESSSAGWKW